MMTMHGMILITITLGPEHRPNSIGLMFDNPPSREQLIEATRHYLTDQDYPNSVALAMMKAVKETVHPDAECNYASSDVAKPFVQIFYDKIVFFKI